jgi:hypothetical protein
MGRPPWHGLGEGERLVERVAPVVVEPPQIGLQGAERLEVVFPLAVCLRDRRRLQHCQHHRRTPPRMLRPCGIGSWVVTNGCPDRARGRRPLHARVTAGIVEERQQNHSNPTSATNADGDDVLGRHNVYSRRFPVLSGTR